MGCIGRPSDFCSNVKISLIWAAFPKKYIRTLHKQGGNRDSRKVFFLNLNVLWSITCVCSLHLVLFPSNWIPSPFFLEINLHVCITPWKDSAQFWINMKKKSFKSNSILHIFSFNISFTVPCSSCCRHCPLCIRSLMPTRDAVVFINYTYNWHPAQCWNGLADSTQMVEEFTAPVLVTEGLQEEDDQLVSVSISLEILTC